jgi:hypothetical protein
MHSKFIFCHYRISMGDEELDANAQLQFLAENQGRKTAHGREHDGVRANALIMTPRQFDVDHRQCLTWWMGYEPGYRVIQNYDNRGQVIRRRVVQDSHIKSALVVAVPSLRVAAFQDKSGDENIPARTAINGLRSIIRATTDDDGNLDVTHVTDDDVRKALDEWELTEYLYTVRPLNPIPGSDRAKRRSDAYKAEGVGKESGRVWPVMGETMRPNEGVIAETRDLVDVGYGQNGLRGITPDGHTAHIPKPAFHMQRDKNLAERDKPRYLRINIETEPEEDGMTNTVARALIKFFG